MADPELIDSGSGGQASAGSDLTVGLDGGAASEGELILVIITSVTATDAYDEPSSYGFTSLGGSGTLLPRYCEVWGRIAGASEPSTYTFENLTANSKGDAIISSWSPHGVSTLSTDIGIAFGAQQPSSPAICPALTVTVGDLIVRAIWHTNNAASSITEPTDTTAIEVLLSASVHTLAAYYEDSVADSTSISTLNVVYSLTSPNSNGITLAIPPSSGGSTAYTLDCAAGAFAFTGQDADLLHNQVLTCGVGSFTLAGQDAGLYRGLVLGCDTGAFVLAGQDADLVYTPTSSATYVLVCELGSFVLAGQDADLLWNKVLACGAGSFVLTGQDAALLHALPAGDPLLDSLVDTYEVRTQAEDAYAVPSREADTYEAPGA